MRTLARLAVVAGLALMAASGIGLAHAGATIDPDTNQVSYWCPNGGVKYDPASTPFTVPAPPAGRTWTLLVLKAGSEESANPVNELFPNPTPGQAYSRTDGKSISHAILCQSPLVTTTYATTTSPSTTLATTTTHASTTLATTTTSPSTTLATTTTASTTTSSSTTLATTTTAPTTTQATTTSSTTSSSTTIATTTTSPTTTSPFCPFCATTTASTVASTTTTQPASTTTTQPATTTTAPATSTTEGNRAITVPEDTTVVTQAPTRAPELPRTGSELVPFTGLGLGALLAGAGASALGRRRKAA